MPRTELAHPAITAAMSAAATLLGMEVVFISGLTEDSFTFERVHGAVPGVREGDTLPRTDSICARLLAGGPARTSDAAGDPSYCDARLRADLQICSYVGVPILDRSGTPVGTLCGVDRARVEVDDNAVAVLTELASIVAAHLNETPDPLPAEPTVIRRTPAGWQVAGEETSDLASAMVLADLLAGEMPPGARPARPAGNLDEVDQLRLSVTQLEHALAARVVVEQAIGVLTERQRLSPRASFERLRKAARTRGRRVHDLAREVVASGTDSSVPLPPELAGRR